MNEEIAGWSRAKNGMRQIGERTAQNGETERGKEAEREREGEDLTDTIE